ncbi:MAG: ribonuclease H-like domain-containing protein [Deltaproteobacteria bacterium]|nr:ribonuclease H-like domain-containing protein [Deltaproteobacteria bacterium]
MLKNTFCHIPGIGAKTERRLWKEGILTWAEACRGIPFRLNRVHSIEGRIEESLIQLERSNPAYFSSLLSPKEQWRILNEFRSSIAYLDIETNGYVGHRGYITAITVYDGRSVRCYIRGRNLEEFKKDIRDYKVIVTYNGRCFDIPFIESHMCMSFRDFAHIDLRFILRDFGIKGGLKGSERHFGIDRGGLTGLDGYSAVLLWNEFKRNRNEKALDTLIAYNIQDVVNLEPLAVLSYNLKLKGTPFEATHKIAMPAPAPETPFKADADVVGRVLSGGLSIGSY